MNKPYLFIILDSKSLNNDGTAHIELLTTVKLFIWLVPLGLCVSWV